MPDISMCTGEGCPKKSECYRHRARPSKYMQTYFATPPVQANGTCAYFSKVEPGDWLRETTDE
jgi:hypothetical protein